MEEIRPCWFMSRWLSRLADGSLRGPARWYTQFHASLCPMCKPALEALRALHQRLRTLGSRPEAGAGLSDDRWDAIRAAWKEIDGEG